jgi:hypothetical protein
MIAKIGLIAAFLLTTAPPIASASNRAATNPALVLRQSHELPPGMVVAQQPTDGAAENGNDNDNDSNSNDNTDDNQNADSNQTEQQYPPTNDQPMPSLAPNGTETDPNSTPQADQAPQPQPMNPYQ